MSDEEQAALQAYIQWLQQQASLYRNESIEQRARAEAAEAEVERLTAKDGYTWLYQERTEALSDMKHWRDRAETAEAEVKRLTRECLDRDNTETDARERLRRLQILVDDYRQFADLWRTGAKS